MKTILGAIVARFDASQAYLDVAASGGLYVEEIPQQKEMPWVLLCHDGDTPEYNFESDYLEECHFRFEVFAVGLAAAEAIAAKIKTAFDLPSTPVASAAFNVTNGYVVSCTRVGYKVSAAGELQETSKQVYQCTLTYILVCRKTL